MTILFIHDQGHKCEQVQELQDDDCARESLDSVCLVGRQRRWGHRGSWGSGHLRDLRLAPQGRTPAQCQHNAVFSILLFILLYSLYYYISFILYIILYILYIIISNQTCKRIPCSYRELFFQYCLDAISL